MFENLAKASGHAGTAAEIAAAKKVFADVMKGVVSDNKAAAEAAAAKFAAAVQVPIQEAIFADPLYGDLFTMSEKDEYDDVVYPKDLIAPGDEEYFAAYSAPRIGAIPQRIVDVDYVRVVMDFKRASLDVPEDALRRGDYDVAAMVVEKLNEGVTTAMNDQAFRTLITAAYGRTDGSGNIIYKDPANPTAALITKAFLAGFPVKFRRTGTSATSTKAFKLTNLYMSPEVQSSLLLLDNTKLDEFTRRELVLSDDGNVSGLMGMRFITLDELGVGKKYQNFLVNSLGATVDAGRNLCIGVDARRKSQMVMPVGMRPTISEDTTLRRHRVRGWWVDVKFGCGVLDNRVAMLGQV